VHGGVQQQREHAKLEHEADRPDTVEFQEP
jgi:hypothetical protein